MSDAPLCKVENAVLFAASLFTADRFRCIAWGLNEQWKAHQGFRGTGIRSIERQDGVILEVPDLPDPGGALRPFALLLGMVLLIWAIPMPDVRLIPESTITCPVCRSAKTEAMPTDACQFFHECSGCGTPLRPKPGDC